MNTNESRKPLTTRTIGWILGTLALTGMLNAGCDQIEESAATLRSGAGADSGQLFDAGKDVQRSMPITYYRR